MIERGPYPADTSLSCIHGTLIADACETCADQEDMIRFVVGGSGPRVIRPGQVWRARGQPYGYAVVPGSMSPVTMRRSVTTI